MDVIEDDDDFMEEYPRNFQVDQEQFQESIEVDDFSSEERSITASLVKVTTSDINREMNRSYSSDSDTSLDDRASVILARCKRYVVRPYNVLLKVIGWRAFSSKRDRCSSIYKLMNVIYPILMYMILVCACVAQMSACFSRTKSVPARKLSDPYKVIECDNHVVTLDLISYMMVIVAYPLALYIFRVAEPEHLTSLAVTVFLSFNDVISSKSRKTPFFILLGILGCGIFLFFVSAFISILRFVALGLWSDMTIISWFVDDETAQNATHLLEIPPNMYKLVHYLLVTLAYFGFLFFDLLYIAVTINYCCQCQLLIFYIENIQDKVRNKKYDTLNIAIKEIHRVYDFLKILNGYVGIVSSLIFFIFLSNAILSYSDLIQPDPEVLNIVTGFVNTVFWTIVTLIPIIMAARLTAKGNELRRLGQEVAARPFYYSRDTPDLELHYFLTFTDSTRYQANLGFIPMQPSFALAVCFTVLLFLSSGIVISQAKSVSWL